jgi:hypothetical protein
MNQDTYASLRAAERALIERFQQFNSDHLKTKELTNILHPRCDLNAFLLLHTLAPSKSGGDMVSSAEHDEIYLDVDIEALQQNASDEDIQNLVRCGIMYHAEYDCLYMFV